MRKRIETPEQAIEYLKKVLRWKAFCDSHRLLEQSIKILVAHHTPEQPAPKHRRCVLCGEILEGHGNNPQPIKSRGECCQKCNEERVIPARLHQLFINKGGKA